MPTASINGLQLYFEEHGQGQPLLCVMGLGGDVSSWSGQLPLWSEHYRTIIFDHRDCGRSSYVEADYEIGDLVDDTVGLADRLGLGRFHLLGVSMGGAVAQELALRFPERVTTLTLCVTYAGAGRWMRERARLSERALPARDDADVLDELMLTTLSADTFENASQIRYLRSLILSYPYAQRRDGFVRQLRASVTHEARDRLPALRLPVHVIGAEQDVLVPVWRSHELVDLIPGARLTVIRGSGHAVNVERAEELAGTVHTFLQGCLTGLAS